MFCGYAGIVAETFLSNDESSSGGTTGSETNIINAVRCGAFPPNSFRLLPDCPYTRLTLSCSSRQGVAGVAAVANDYAVRKFTERGGVFRGYGLGPFLNPTTVRPYKTDTFFYLSQKPCLCW